MSRRIKDVSNGPTNTHYRVPLAAKMAIAALAAASDFDAYQFAQSYMESRGYLRGDKNARMIQPLMAWALLTRHKDDPDKTRPLLVEYGLALEELRKALQNAKNQSGTATDVIQKYARVQHLADKVGKREMVATRATAYLFLSRLDEETGDEWSSAGMFGTSDQVPTKFADIFSGAGLDTVSVKDLVIRAKKDVFKTGSVYRSWNLEFKAEKFPAGWILSGGNVFDAAVQQKVNEALTADDEEW